MKDFFPKLFKRILENDYKNSYPIILSGINSADINKYADLYDEPPPENDQQAKELSAKIKKWISDGRPKPN